MNYKKRIISAAIVASLALTSVMSGSVLAAKKTDDGLTYKVSGKAATITGYKGKTTKVTIPAKIGKYTVNKIGKNAFLGNTKIKSVSVPKTVTAIEYGAFGGASKLSKVTFASGSKLSSVGKWAFGRSGIKSVKLPNTVKKLGTDVFKECYDLEEAKLGTGISAIPNNAFYWDGALTKVSFSKSVKKIGDSAFGFCGQLSSMTGTEGLETIGEYAFVCGYSIGDIDFSNVKNIGFGAFDSAALDTVEYKNTSLTVGRESHFRSTVKSVTFPKQVTSIEYGAFNACDSLYEVKLPEKVGSITGGCFNNTSWINDQKEPVYVGDNLLLARTGQSSLAIKQGTKKICEFAFEGESKLGSVTIPDGVEVIGEGAFFDTDLTTVTIPESVTEIGNLALGYKLYTYTTSFYDYYDVNGNFDGDAYNASITKEKETNGVLNYNNWNSYGVNDTTDIRTKYCYGECVKIKDFTIRGKSGSPAEAYAKTWGFKFVAI